MYFDCYDLFRDRQRNSNHTDDTFSLNDDHDKYDDDSYEEDSYEEDDNDGEMEQVAQQESAAQETRKRKRKRHDERRYEDQYLLCLYYCEEYVEPIQIPYDTCDPTMTTGNRIREGYELRPIPFDDISAQCWLDLIGDPCTAFNDDCGSEPLEECASCMTPDCPCGTYVPLALITRTSEGIDIDMSGVRRLLTPPRYLTHIIDTSWEHGGTLELDELRDERGELRIYFDRSLLPNNGKIGISEATFSVYALDEDQELRFLGDEEVRPRLEDHDQNANSVAVFTIERKDLTGRKTIAGSTLYITLKCDFILDCHNNPVDGNFLCAQFPTGDGISGGTFESWFHVVDSRDSYD